MRFIFAFALLTAAGPALAQTDHRLLAREQELMVQQQMLQQRSIALENQLSAIDARVRTEQALSDLRVQQLTPPLRLRDNPAAMLPSVGPGGFASVPDDRLEQSNRRVREASGNRR